MFPGGGGEDQRENSMGDRGERFRAREKRLPLQKQPAMISTVLENEENGLLGWGVGGHLKRS